MGNSAAKLWLETQGYICEEEPDWITSGRKPDFFCSGSNDFWVEVKTFELEKKHAMLGTAHQKIRERAKTIRGKGTAICWVKTPLSDLVAKKLFLLVDREINIDRTVTDEEKLVVMVPEHPNYNKFVRFSFALDDGTKATISSYESKIGKYGWPGYLTPKSYYQDIDFKSSDGKQKKINLREITTFDDNVLIAIELMEGKGSFKVISTAPVNGASKVNTVDRIRKVVTDANSQSKNGCKFRKAPALTVIYHDDALVPEDEMIVSALYGDLAYTAPADKFEDGELVFTTNGVIGPGKNRTTSAVCYFRNGAPPLIVHNLWAESMLEVNLLRGRHIIPKSDGHFELKEI